MESHPSTNQAQLCLASEIRRDQAHSGWHGHRCKGSFRKECSMTYTPYKALCSFCLELQHIPSFSQSELYLKAKPFWEKNYKELNFCLCECNTKTNKQIDKPNRHIPKSPEKKGEMHPILFLTWQKQSKLCFLLDLEIQINQD